jgi:hypothetical protein
LHIVVDRDLAAFAEMLAGWAAEMFKRLPQILRIKRYFRKRN